MRKLFAIILAASLAATAFGQKVSNTYQYPTYHQGGIKIGKSANSVVIDSATVKNGNLVYYKAGAALNPIGKDTAQLSTLVPMLVDAGVTYVTPAGMAAYVAANGGGSANSIQVATSDAAATGNFYFNPNTRKLNVKTDSYWYRYTKSDSTAITAPAVNLIVNGDFATTTGWTLGTWGWVITGGKCTKTENGGSSVDQTVKTLDYGKNYSVTFTLSGVTGGQIVFATGFGGAGHETTPRTANGTYTETISTAANVNGWENQMYFNVDYGFLGSVDDIIFTLVP